VLTTIWRSRSTKSVRAIGLSMLLILMGCGTSHATQVGKESSTFCAVLSDSVGLYTGNPVTQMGLPIGTVTSIKATDTAAEVTFVIDEDRRIPQDVKAVVRSPSILADRSLELVGNYHGGPEMRTGDCIPRSRTATPLSISQIIGSATDFVNAITPDGSTNVQASLRGIDEAVRGNGKGVNELLARSSALLDNPDQTIAELGAITRNVAELTTILRDNRAPLKSILQDSTYTGPLLVKALQGGGMLSRPLPELVLLVNDLELQLGPELQLALDTVAESARILVPHYKGLADLLNPLPRFISGLNGEPAGATAGGLAKHINNHVFDLLTWRPALYRIPAPAVSSLVNCGAINAVMPGSCADVEGRPYVVDVALLQYVLAQAARQ
jgi:phospholipid/cholesterol/gamma-HCH transport system substrate-binding protein